MLKSVDFPVEKEFNSYSPKDYILIKGARMHNLKNVDVIIPRGKFVVITGLSGSGKSSLAFDTLYAEGQRRYVESLSAYARQFLGRLEKPLVDYIKGISPAIAIEQKVVSRNPRSTVGTVTEVYDYLKLLYTRIGKTYSPLSGKLVKRHSVSDVCDYILQLPLNYSAYVMTVIEAGKKETLQKQLQLLKQQGFSRIFTDNQVIRLDEIDPKKINPKKEIYLLIDRVHITERNEELENRLSDSIQTAFNEGEGKLYLLLHDEKNNSRLETFSSLFEEDGISFEEPSLNFFSFNNPVGACKTCEGFGSIIGIDPDLVIPNKSLSVYNNAIACWNGETMSWYKKQLIKKSHLFNFPIHKPIAELSKKEYDLLWKGNEHFEGIYDFFKMLEKESYKIQYRVMLARYRGKTVCPDCEGTRLRKDANYVMVGNKCIRDIILMPVKEALAHFNQLKLNSHEEKIAKRILTEIKNRLNYLHDVGLGYLSLNRVAGTLSGGESQRINLATQLGSSLVGSLYILDEPSIGLHPRDTQKLIGVLKALQKQGNTVIVVEHDEEIMQAADVIIDIGPEAGSNGGELIYNGPLQGIEKIEKSYTGKYLSGKLKIETPKHKRPFKEFIEVKNVSYNNLKNVHVKFPLNTLCAVTGVSGSGKSSLVKNALVPYLQKYIDGYFTNVDHSSMLGGHLNKIQHVEYVDQNPIGKSSRSNPATYTKAYDEIRTLFSEQSLAKARGYKAGHFSFNVEGGRCEICQGEGVNIIEMQFMADVELICEACQGKRFKADTLEILYKGKSIADILDFTVEDAINFFMADKNSRTANKIIEKLKPLQQVGLGYVKLGQSSNTLSGGEAQRVKLATFLQQGSNSGNILFVFDEPTTGLHFHDINKLLHSFYALLEKGHSIVVIEHNMEVVKCADWVIDLGPESGDEGGYVVFEGKPEELINCTKSITGTFLKKHFN